MSDHAQSVEVPTKRWANLREAAHYAGVHQRTITRMIERGDLKGYRFGGKLLRISLTELDEAMQPIPTDRSPE